MKLLSSGLIFIFLIASSLSFSSDYEYPQTPKCPSKGTKEVWQKNFDGCMGPFRINAGNKRFKMKDAEGTCRCVTDGIVNSLTCGEMKRERDDKKYSERFMNSVLKKCKPKMTN